MTSTSKIKTQLWTVASRLQRAQSKFEALAQAARKDIASSITREYHLRSSGITPDDVEHEKLLGSLRLKAEKLIVDDESCDLMGILERYCDVLQEGALSETAVRLDQDCLEAVSGILATSSRVDSPELHTLCHSLAQRYPDLTMESELRENVALKLVPHINPGRPTQTSVDAKLVTIAQSHGLGNWAPPGLLPADRQKDLMAMLAFSTEFTVDKGRLRYLCSYAVPPGTPAWVRLRAWSIVLGVLPVEKSNWHSSISRGSRDYVTLAQQVLETLANAQPLDGSSSLSSQDKAILQFSKDVEALPGSIRDALLQSIVASPPTSGSTNDEPLMHADAVTSRIHMIKSRNRPEAHSTQITPLIPTITLDDPPTSPFSPTSMYTNQNQTTTAPATVLLPSASTSSSTSDTILLRLLYIHSMLHSSHATSLGPSSSLAAIFAVVLTIALQARSTPSESLRLVDESGSMSAASLVEVEAEVFWLVEAIVSNTRELLEGSDEGDETWTRRFSNVVRWADNDLWMDLSRKGLDPALPYYSYRWIPTLFTHTLPLDTLLPIWDTIFSVPPNTSQHGHKIAPQSEFIYTIGATMLIRARAAIFQSSLAGQDVKPHAAGNTSPSGGGGLTTFWKRQSKGPAEITLPHSPSAYSPIASPKTPLSPTVSAVPRGTFPDGRGHGHEGSLTPGRLSNIFLVAVELLQEYDINSFGGIERLICGALSLWRRWCREGRPSLESPAFHEVPRYANVANAVQGEPVAQTAGGVAAGLNRLRDLAWKGITNEVDDDSRSPSPAERDVEARRPLTPQLTITSPVSEKGTGAGFFSSISSGLGTGFSTKLTESVWKGVTNQLDSPEPSPDGTPDPSPRSSMLVADDEVQPGSSWSGEGALSWAKGYADKLKASETAANLSRTGTTLRSKASTVWAADARHDEQQHPEGPPVVPNGQRGPQVPPILPQHEAVARSQSGTISPANSSVGSWSEIFSKRGSLPLVGSLIGDAKSREGSEASFSGNPALQKDVPNVHKRESYSPPVKPSHFRAARDSVMGSIFSPGPTVTSPDLSHLPSSPLSAASDGSTKNPLQAALAALSGSPKVEAPKRGPKPLLLNSGSLITPSGTRSGLNSRTPSRRPSPSPTPTPRPGDRFSLSTEGEEASFSHSGVVSLRRGPLTNPRTAGYGVSSTSRDGTRSSRASTSSGMSSPALSAHAFSVDLDSETERRGQSVLAKKPSRVFLIDRGPQAVMEDVQLEESLVLPAEIPPLEANRQVGSSDDSEARKFDDDETGATSTRMPTKPRLKRHQNRPAPIATDPPSVSADTLPELMITTPRSGDTQPRHVSHLQEDNKELTVIGASVSSVGGASLSRSRSSTRRVKRSRDGSAEERTPRAMRRPGSAYEDNRDSMLSVGGSEEEGSKADVEDLDDIYEMY